MHHQFGDSGDDFDRDVDQRTGSLGGRSGRIILLGDGTEVLTSKTDNEKVQPTSRTPEAMDTSDPFDSPTSTMTEKSSTEEKPPPYVRAAGDSDVPEKLANPAPAKA